MRQPCFSNGNFNFGLTLGPALSIFAAMPKTDIFSGRSGCVPTLRPARNLASPSVEPVLLFSEIFPSAGRFFLRFENCRTVLRALLPAFSERVGQASSRISSGDPCKHFHPRLRA